MERTTTMKTFDCNLPPKSPTILRDMDASFSSYLTPQKPNTCQPNNHNHLHKLDDPTSELSIFDAHKYFNEGTNNDNIQKVTISNNNNNNNNNSRVSPMVINVNNETENIVIPDSTRYSSASSVDGYANIRNYRARSFHAATPTASSEASWNSQQGLLSHPAGAISVNIKNPSNPNPNNNNKHKSSISKPNWFLRRKCPCSGKKSVQVNEKKSTELPKNSIKIPSPISPSPPPPPMNNNWINNNIDQTQNHVVTKSQRFQPVVTTTVRVPYTDGFTFPVLNPNSSSTTTKLKNGIVLEDPPRESLEVFRPPEELTVDAKTLNFQFPPGISRIVIDDNDAASDASSDLFEIESFSTATQSSYSAAVYRRNSRDSFDEGSVTTAMTECYEPSEASIDWSVTTAEGYDESSITAASIGGYGGGGGGGGGVTAEHWKRKGGNGLLVSCRCEKAVSVGPQPVKCEGQRGATSAWKQVNGGGVISSRVGGVNINKPPLARSSHSHQRNSNNTPRVTSFAFAT